MQSKHLNRVFGALSDPIRRGILERLAEGEANISTLAAPYEVSQPAISRHLQVLERAGLIVRKRDGREHQIRVNPAPIEEAQGWIGHYARFWRRQFDAVDMFLKKQAREKNEVKP